MAVAMAGSLPQAAAAAAERTPLQVSIETLSPSTVPDRGRVRMTGEITNRSNDTWTDLQVFMFTSSEPIRSDTELAEQAGTDPAASVGDRLTAGGLYDEVGDLAPGASTSYTLSVPRRDLGIGGEPGVYWIGVHVLGAVDGVRVDGADGRARTFIPSVPARSDSTELALLMPVTAPVSHRADGRLADVKRWTRLLGPEGRLDRILDLSGQTAHQPFTWVLDPAVLDAVRALADGNPPRDIGPDDGTDGSGDATTGPSAEGSPSASPPSASPSTGQEGEDGETPPTPEQQVARAWLDEFRRQASIHSVVTLPYGALDVAAVFDGQKRRLYDEAARLSAETVQRDGVPAGPVVAPSTGYLPRSALARIGADTPVVLSDRAFPAATTPVAWAAGGAPVILTDSAAGSGGPAPGRRHTALTLRQRLVSEAALHARSPNGSTPLVVTLPRTWNPGPRWNVADFFFGLDLPWLRMVDLDTVTVGTLGTPSGPPVYSERERNAQVPFANVLATEDLARTGDVLANLLARNDSVDDDIARSALLASSENARRRPEKAMRSARATVDRLRSTMQDVSIEGPSFATLSSGQGPIQVTVVNGMDEPVTVGIDARTPSGDLHIRAPDPVTLGPGTRAAVRLEATATGIGVHSVTLVATNSDGEPIGTFTRFNVRTSQVGFVIWIVMGLGAAILLLAIVLRVVRRVRRGPAPAPEPAGHPSPGPVVEDPTR
jgi:hypothetical protein